MRTIISILLTNKFTLYKTSTNFQLPSSDWVSRAPVQKSIRNRKQAWDIVFTRTVVVEYISSSSANINSTQHFLTHIGTRDVDFRHSDLYLSAWRFFPMLSECSLSLNNKIQQEDHIHSRQSGSEFSPTSSEFTPPRSYELMAFLSFSESEV